jgi:hypothetical protein
MKHTNLTASALMALKQPSELVNLFERYAIASGEKKIVNRMVADVARVHGKKVAGSTTVSFFDNYTAGDASNWAGQNTTLPEGQPLLVTGIRILSGTGATANITPWVAGLSSFDTLNGNLTITCQKVKLRAYPLEEFFVNANNTETSKNGYIELSQPIFINSQMAFNVVLNFDTAPATANQNVCVELIGIGTIS